MNRRKTKIVAAWTCLAFAIAAAPSALAWWDPSKGPETYKTYEDGCARWRSQGGGQGSKCILTLPLKNVPQG